MAEFWHIWRGRLCVGTRDLGPATLWTLPHISNIKIPHLGEELKMTSIAEYNVLWTEILKSEPRNLSRNNHTTIHNKDVSVFTLTSHMPNFLQLVRELTQTSEPRILISQLVNDGNLIDLVLVPQCLEMQKLTLPDFPEYLKPSLNLLCITRTYSNFIIDIGKSRCAFKENISTVQEDEVGGVSKKAKERDSRSRSKSSQKERRIYTVSTDSSDVSPDQRHRRKDSAHLGTANMNIKMKSKYTSSPKNKLLNTSKTSADSPRKGKERKDFDKESTSLKHDKELGNEGHLLDDRERNKPKAKKDKTIKKFSIENFIQRRNTSSRKTEDLVDKIHRVQKEKNLFLDTKTFRKMFCSQDESRPDLVKPSMLRKTSKKLDPDLVISSGCNISAKSNESGQKTSNSGLKHSEHTEKSNILVSDEKGDTKHQSDFINGTVKSPCRKLLSPNKESWKEKDKSNRDNKISKQQKSSTSRSLSVTEQSKNPEVCGITNFPESSISESAYQVSTCQGEGTSKDKESDIQEKRNILGRKRKFDGAGMPEENHHQLAKKARVVLFDIMKHPIEDKELLQLSDFENSNVFDNHYMHENSKETLKLKESKEICKDSIMSNHEHPVAGTQETAIAVDMNNEQGLDTAEEAVRLLHDSGKQVYSYSHEDEKPLNLTLPNCLTPVESSQSNELRGKRVEISNMFDRREKQEVEMLSHNLPVSKAEKYYLLDKFIETMDVAESVVEETSVGPSISTCGISSCTHPVGECPPQPVVSCKTEEPESSVDVVDNFKGLIGDAESSGDTETLNAVNVFEKKYICCQSPSILDTACIRSEGYLKSDREQVTCLDLSLNKLNVVSAMESEQDKNQLNNKLKVDTVIPNTTVPETLLVSKGLVLENGTICAQSLSILESVYGESEENRNSESGDLVCIDLSIKKPGIADVMKSDVSSISKAQEGLDSTRKEEIPPVSISSYNALDLSVTKLEESHRKSAYVNVDFCSNKIMISPSEMEFEVKSEVVVKIEDSPLPDNHEVVVNIEDISLPDNHLEVGDPLPHVMPAVEDMFNRPQETTQLSSSVISTPFGNPASCLLSTPCQPANSIAQDAVHKSMACRIDRLKKILTGKTSEVVQDGIKHIENIIKKPIRIPSGLLQTQISTGVKEKCASFLLSNAQEKKRHLDKFLIRHLINFNVQKAVVEDGCSGKFSMRPENQLSYSRMRDVHSGRVDAPKLQKHNETVCVEDMKDRLQPSTANDSKLMITDSQYLDHVDVVVKCEGQNVSTQSQTTFRGAPSQNEESEASAFQIPQESQGKDNPISKRLQAQEYTSATHIQYEGIAGIKIHQNCHASTNQLVNNLSFTRVPHTNDYISSSVTNARDRFCDDNTHNPYESSRSFLHAHQQSTSYSCDPQLIEDRALIPCSHDSRFVIPGHSVISASTNAKLSHSQEHCVSIHNQKPQDLCTTLLPNQTSDYSHIQTSSSSNSTYNIRHPIDGPRTSSTYSPSCISDNCASASLVSNSIYSSPSRTCQNSCDIHFRASSTPNSCVSRHTHADASHVSSTINSSSPQHLLSKGSSSNLYSQSNSESVPRGYPAHFCSTDNFILNPCVPMTTRTTSFRHEYDHPPEVNGSLSVQNDDVDMNQSSVLKEDRSLEKCVAIDYNTVRYFSASTQSLVEYSSSLSPVKVSTDNNQSSAKSLFESSLGSGQFVPHSNHCHQNKSLESISEENTNKDCDGALSRNKSVNHDGSGENTSDSKPPQICAKDAFITLRWDSRLDWEDHAKQISVEEMRKMKYIHLFNATKDDLLKIKCIVVRKLARLSYATLSEIEENGGYILTRPGCIEELFEHPNITRLCMKDNIRFGIYNSLSNVVKGGANCVLMSRYLMLLHHTALVEESLGTILELVFEDQESEVDERHQVFIPITTLKVSIYMLKTCRKPTRKEKDIASILRKNLVLIRKCCASGALHVINSDGKWKSLSPESSVAEFEECMRALHRYSYYSYRYVYLLVGETLKDAASPIEHFYKVTTVKDILNTKFQNLVVGK